MGGQESISNNSVTLASTIRKVTRIEEEFGSSWY